MWLAHSSRLAVARSRSRRCTYKEGTRRCPYDGEGEPSLCRAHCIALAEAARPRAPARVLLDSLGDWLQGKPINRHATIGAAEDFLNQWAGNLGSEYHPDVMGGQSEDSVHRQGQPGTPYWWNAAGHWWQNLPSANAGPSGGDRTRSRPRPPPPPPHPQEDLIRARVAARQVMGFAPKEVLDAALIKKRHRILVAKHHPDRGGSHKKMSAINAAKDILVAAL